MIVLKERPTVSEAELEACSAKYAQGLKPFAAADLRKIILRFLPVYAAQPVGELPWYYKASCIDEQFKNENPIAASALQHLAIFRQGGRAPFTPDQCFHKAIAQMLELATVPPEALGAGVKKLTTDHERNKRWCEMHASGMTYAEIGRAENCPADRVRKAVDKKPKKEATFTNVWLSVRSK
jgi:hypothetical protein